MSLNNLDIKAVGYIVFNKGLEHRLIPPEFVFSFFLIKIFGSRQSKIIMIAEIKVFI